MLNLLCTLEPTDQLQVKHTGTTQVELIFADQHRSFSAIIGKNHLAAAIRYSRFRTVTLNGENEEIVVYWDEDGLWLEILPQSGGFTCPIAVCVGRSSDLLAFLRSTPCTRDPKNRVSFTGLLDGKTAVQWYVDGLYHTEVLSTIDLTRAHCSCQMEVDSYAVLSGMYLARVGDQIAVGFTDKYGHDWEVLVPATMILEPDHLTTI